MVLEQRLAKCVTSHGVSFSYLIILSFSNDRLIKLVKASESSSILSPSSLWDLASYSLGWAPETSVRKIEVSIEGARKLLNVSGGNRCSLISWSHSIIVRLHPYVDRNSRLSMTAAIVNDFRKIKHVLKFFLTKTLAQTQQFVVCLLSFTWISHQLTQRHSNSSPTE